MSRYIYSAQGMAESQLVHRTIYLVITGAELHAFFFEEPGEVYCMLFGFPGHGLEICAVDVAPSPPKGVYLGVKVVRHPKDVSVLH